jgi:hypothetical protein
LQSFNINDGQANVKNYSGDCTLFGQEAEFRNSTGRFLPAPALDPELNQISNLSRMEYALTLSGQGERLPLVNNGFAVEMQIVNPLLQLPEFFRVLVRCPMRLADCKCGNGGLSRKAFISLTPFIPANLSQIRYVVYYFLQPQERVLKRFGKSIPDNSPYSRCCAESIPS